MGIRVLVAGGGISGLSAAYTLLKNASAADCTLDLHLVEAGPAWGGKIVTERTGGFVIEGGPDTFLATKPWGVAMCRELGLGDRLQGTNLQQKKTYVLRSGRLEPLPEGLTMMIPSQVAPMIRTGLLSWPEKMRMGLDFFLPPQRLNGDESLGAFVTRRLGRAAYERLIEPLMSGIYAGDGDQLSLQSTFPYLRDMELEHGGLVKGALAMRRKMAAAGIRPGARSIFLTPQTGLGEIVEALVARLEAGGANLRLSTPVLKVRRDPSGYLVDLPGGETLEVAGLILATPPYVSAGFLEDLDQELAQELRSIPYVSTATVSLAYRESDIPRPLDGYGYVIPRREGRKALACTWTSTKFPHRAPEGHALLRVFIGRAGQEDDLPDDEAGLLAIARLELRQTLGIAAEPLLSRVFYWDQAMPQYNLGHPSRLERINAVLKQWPGLALAGNGYRGIGIPDCIYSGELAAQQLAENVCIGERSNS